MATKTKTTKKTTKRTTPKAPTGRARAKFSCLHAAALLLRENGKPMTCGAMIDAMRAKKLWTSDAPTPQATLHSALMREINTKKADSRFAKVGRGTFARKA